jgi:pilus assembly protein TadC
MSIGGLLLGLVVGAVFGFFVNGPLWLFGRFGYVLPALFGIAGSVAARRTRVGRAISIAGFAVSAATMVLGLLVAAAFCWWMWTILSQKHGWF